MFSMQKWFWRISLVCIAVFLTMGFFRLSFDAFKSYFAGMIASELSYPKARISVESGREDLLSIVVMLEPFFSDLPNAVDPNDLAVRLSAASVGTVTSPDLQRVNGYSFLQAFLKKSERVTIEYIHRVDGEDRIYDSKIIDSLQIMKAEPTSLGALKGSALVPSETPKVPLSVFQWIAIAILGVIGGMYVALKLAQRRNHDS